MLESKFQANLKKKIKAMFKGCIILKVDPNDIQGIPDLLVLYKRGCFFRVALCQVVRYKKKKRISILIFLNINLQLFVKLLV